MRTITGRSGRWAWFWWTVWLFALIVGLAFYGSHPKVDLYGYLCIAGIFMWCAYSLLLVLRAAYRFIRQ